MNRVEFIKTLGLGAGGIILPKTLFTQKPVKIYDNYISGHWYYSYNEISSQLKEGLPLSLVREPENVYDSFAVEVYFQDHKIGYLKAYENIAIANMLDAGATLNAEISLHQPNDYNQNVLAVAIFAELILATPKLINELQNIRADNAPDIYRNNF